MTNKKIEEFCPKCNSTNIYKCTSKKEPNSDCFKCGDCKIIDENKNLIRKYWVEFSYSPKFLTGRYREEFNDYYFDEVFYTSKRVFSKKTDCIKYCKKLLRKKLDQLNKMERKWYQTTAKINIKYAS